MSDFINDFDKEIVQRAGKTTGRNHIANISQNQVSRQPYLDSTTEHSLNELVNRLQLHSIRYVTGMLIRFGNQQCNSRLESVVDVINLVSVASPLITFWTCLYLRDLEPAQTTKFDTINTQHTRHTLFFYQCLAPDIFHISMYRFNCEQNRMSK